jgi:hypothetical protein
MANICVAVGDIERVAPPEQVATPVGDPLSQVIVLTPRPASICAAEREIRQDGG